MEHPDAPDFWRKDFVATLGLVGSAAARLPYGVPEPVLGGQAAVELYSGGLWTARQVELLTTEARCLRAELMDAGFRRDDCSPSHVCNLRHPRFDRGVNITTRAPIDANVVAVEIGTAGRQDTTTIRVVGVEDLIADQVKDWLGQGRPSGGITTLIQVLVELGRAGVAGPFRPAYLQRRLARETGGEAVLELPLAPYGLDDPAPRMTSLTSIAAVVGSWRASRNLPPDAADLFGGPHRLDRKPSGVRNRTEITEKGRLGVRTAQIIPFRPDGR
jgi:hypothetical protein